jgi:pimeloyl-ACP methyl ester carboxylesterase
LAQKTISLNPNFSLAYHELNVTQQQASVSKPILNIVLIHAYPLSSSMYLHTFTERNLAELAKHDCAFQINILCPDLPGFGDSTLLDEKPQNLMPLVDILHAFCKRLELRNIIIGGCSMGGYLSLAFAQNYPEQVKGIILLDTKAEADTPDARQIRLDNISLIEKEILAPTTKNQEHPTIGELMTRNKSIHDIIYGLFQKLFYRQNPNTEKLGTQIMKMIETQKAIALTHALSAMAGRDESHTILAHLKIPVLIIVGSHDVITPIVSAQAMQNSAGAAAELYIIQNAGHLAIMEQAADCIQIIKKWLGNFL